MSVYMVFPVFCFWLFNQPQFYEKVMSKDRVSDALHLKIVYYLHISVMTDVCSPMINTEQI